MCTANKNVWQCWSTFGTVCPDGKFVPVDAHMLTKIADALLYPHPPMLPHAASVAFPIKLHYVTWLHPSIPLSWVDVPDVLFPMLFDPCLPSDNWDVHGISFGTVLFVDSSVLAFLRILVYIKKVENIVLAFMYYWVIVLEQKRVAKMYFYSSFGNKKVVQCFPMFSRFCLDNCSSAEWTELLNCWVYELKQNALNL